MAMDDETQKSFINFLAKQMKLYFRELLAHQFVLHVLRENGVSGVDNLLEIARKSEAVEKKMAHHFEKFDELLPPTQKEIFDQRVRELLEQWRSTGEPN